MIELINLQKKYSKENHQVLALNNLSLKIEDKSFLALKGPSGSGKSTLLNILGLIDVPDAGEYLFNGVNIVNKNVSQRSDFRKKNLGFVFQNYNLIPELTVYENVEIPLLIQGLNRKDIKNKVELAIENVGLLDYMKHKPGELSGGQQQRVSIARAMVRMPPIIIADEPTANLDSDNSKSIISSMKEINRKFGITFIFATHDEMILDYMDQVVYMRDGKITDRK